MEAAGMLDLARGKIAAELALLRDRWGQMQESLGQVAVVRGEAGIGKSRLVHEWKEELAEIPHVWWECRCSPYHRYTAFHPLVALFQRALYWQVADSEAGKLAKLEALLGQYALKLWAEAKAHIS
jgi:predicted ATPase